MIYTKVKIEILDWEELDGIEVTGKVISGNFNLDGNSIIRRTISLSLVPDSEEVLTELEAGKKVRVSATVDLKNWVPLGVFILLNPIIRRNPKGIEVSIEGYDKMALMTEVVGGVFSTPTSFYFRDVLTDKDRICSSRRRHTR